MRICLLASGSNGNCLLLESGNQRLLIDVGIGPVVLARRLALLELAPRDITDVLLTHEHVDHVRGLTGLLKRQPDVRIHATRGTRSRLESDIAKRVLPVRAGEVVRLGVISARPFAVSHDAREPVGYRVETPEGSLGYATDLGTFDETLLGALGGAQVLVLESNHCPNQLAVGPYPAYLKRRVAGPKGHLSNPQARALIKALLHDDLRYLALAHLSATNNTPGTVADGLADLLAHLPAQAWAVGRRDGPLDPVRIEGRGRLCGLASSTFRCSAWGVDPRPSGYSSESSPRTSTKVGHHWAVISPWLGVFEARRRSARASGSGTGISSSLAGRSL